MNNGTQEEYKQCEHCNGRCPRAYTHGDTATGQYTLPTITGASSSVERGNSGMHNHAEYVREVYRRWNRFVAGSEGERGTATDGDDPETDILPEYELGGEG